MELAKDSTESLQDNSLFTSDVRDSDLADREERSVN